MEIWLDTIDEETIQLGNRLGFIEGVTTNPSILKHSLLPREEEIKRLLRLQPGKVAVQVEATSSEEIYNEAKELVQISERIIPKIPVHLEGLLAIRKLTQEGILTIATTIFSEKQALLAALAGAMYVAPYLKRMEKPWEFLERIPRLFAAQKLKTKILAASIPEASWITECALKEVGAITIKETVFREWLEDEPQTMDILINGITAWGSNFSVR